MSSETLKLRNTRIGAVTISSTTNTGYSYNLISINRWGKIIQHLGIMDNSCNFNTHNGRIVVND